MANYTQKQIEEVKRRVYRYAYFSKKPVTAQMVHKDLRRSYAFSRKILNRLVDDKLLKRHKYSFMTVYDVKNIEQRYLS